MGFVFLHNGILTVPQELALNPIPRPKVSDFYRRWSVTSFTDLKSQVLSLRENRKSSGKGALPFGQGHTGSFLTRQETLTIRSSSSTQGLPVRITALRGHCLPDWTYFYSSAPFALTSPLLRAWTCKTFSLKFISILVKRGTQYFSNQVPSTRGCREANFQVSHLIPLVMQKAKTLQRIPRPSTELVHLIRWHPSSSNSTCVVGRQAGLHLNT